MAETTSGASMLPRSGGRPIGAYLQLAAAMATVGSSAVVGKTMVESLPIFFASALRFALAAAVLVPVLVRATGGLPRVAARDVGAVVLQALTGVFGFSVLWLYGLRQTTAAEAGIVASTTPAAIALASFLLLGERPRRRRLAGVAVAVAGVGAMTAFGEPSAARGPNPPLGNLLILGAVVGEALFVVLGKRTGARLPPLTIATGVTVAGFLLFLPPAVPEAAALDLAAVPAGAWLAVAYYALGPTVLGYLLLYRGLARVPAGAAAAFTGVVPLSAVLLAALLLGESIAWPHLVGLVGVLGAIALAVSESREAPDDAIGRRGAPAGRHAARRRRSPYPW